MSVETGLAAYWDRIGEVHHAGVIAQGRTLCGVTAIERMQIEADADVFALVTCEPCVERIKKSMRRLVAEMEAVVIDVTEGEAEPFVCPKCGQRGDRRPGFRRRLYPEAVGVNDEAMVPVDSFECVACGYGFVVPVGTIEVRGMPWSARKAEGG